jgi:hypothetical protein
MASELRFTAIVKVLQWRPRQSHAGHGPAPKIRFPSIGEYAGRARYLPGNFNQLGARQRTPRARRRGVLHGMAPPDLGPDSVSTRKCTTRPAGPGAHSRVRFGFHRLSAARRAVSRLHDLRRFRRRAVGVARRTRTAHGKALVLMAEPDPQRRTLTPGPAGSRIRVVSVAARPWCWPRRHNSRRT